MMTAIVYTSNTGYTAAYARMLGEKLGLPVYSLKDAKKQLEKGREILYLGWLMASVVRGYRAASRRFRVVALCAVGLCDTGTLMAEVRKTNSLSAELPLFTLQGGMDHAKLRGINKFMINGLIKMLSSKKSLDEGETRMLMLIKTGGDLVREENLSAFLEWYHRSVG